MLALLAAQFAWRSWRTHRIFNDTADEEIHIACGLEVWEQRKYRIEPQHPPLARVLLAALPHAYLDRAHIHGTWWRSDNEEHYWRTLSLARWGNLVFLPFLLLYANSWARALYGPWAGLGAAFLVAFCPNLLAHASLATLDFGAATGIFAAAYHLWRWSREPARTALSLDAGLVFGLAALTKFSALFVIPVMGVALFAVSRTFPGLRMVLGFGLAAALVIWAGYGFSYGTMPGVQFAPPPESLQQTVQETVEDWVDDRPVPAPVFWRGVLDVLGHNAQGHQGYLLGKVSQTGWWYYFPVVLAVKSTLPLLALTVLGAAFGRRAAAPAVAAGALLAVCMTSNLNLGVRHILAMYPLLAVIASGAFASGRRVVLAGALGLAAWQAGESLAAHPDYLAYFNQIARGREEQFLLDSNLDWGQDLQRLRLYLRQNGIETVYLSFFGRGEAIRRRIPGVRPMPPHHPPRGWAAVSQAHLVGLALPGYNLGWLKHFRPRARIGKSILVYYFPERPL